MQRYTVTAYHGHDEVDVVVEEDSGGDFYAEGDVKALAQKILTGNRFEERNYVNVQLPREVWEEILSLTKE